MRATRLFAINDIRTVDVPVPVPAAGEVLVQVEACGICGTDRHLLHGEFPSKPPLTLGHEFSGIVVGRGAGVSIPEGTRVTCDPNTWCGTCENCLRGRVNLCLNNVATGIHRDGGFAEFCAYPAHKAHPLPADLDPLHGAFCEPLACTIHGVDMGAPKAGERALILGGGVIGMLALQLCVAAGSEVMLLTRSPAKQALGRSLGAAITAATEEEARALWPKGADLVIECAGVTDTVECAPRLTRSGGRVVILGVLPAGQTVRIEPFDLLFREVQLLSSFINPFTQDRAARMIATGAIRIDPVISRILPLEEAAAAIIAPAPPGEIRAIVRP
ncbi:zinc-dependent alcohol dehydrogenase family protein [Rhodobacteraceae bacterium HSP-20]|uniref:Zinc-dependent alcohol dehydrogenase family protein n=1 Tax=Paragemmobacter amnigenus TaxID=2852097 RepID=A0ABS6J1E2_9RHOB|nr:zinc-dependent alcohol dehydrogenase family protein [Rhodobacter amnigenus]MBU9696282.1 zinc-dependent alcohol dehydrogenase family protein [Rhodobacter amnigenus]MBV4387509.1 zinc-dependent alcohol dehydrogenase family protein [Rhodobacter amnigenus]